MLKNNNNQLVMTKKQYAVFFELLSLSYENGAQNLTDLFVTAMTYNKDVRAKISEDQSKTIIRTIRLMNDTLQLS